MRIEAPAKLNLCLFLGPRREDGLHELCSLFEPLALADSVEVLEAERDEVVCPGVEGENLATRALAVLRDRGWSHPPLRLRIEKRIPVAAGLGGGSADAAAVLRLARDGGAPWATSGPAGEASGLAGETFGPAGETSGPAGVASRTAPGADALDLKAIAAELGADVPSQLLPALSLVRGAGERVERLPQPAPHAVVLLPGGGGLSTAQVFAEADRLGLGRSAAELDELADRLRIAGGAGETPLSSPALLVNDLEPAALSLRPQIGEALDALREAGAPVALLTGSGPTAFGLFPDMASAEAVAAKLDRDDAIVCEAGRAP